jgi:ATP/maltotriose-dependent transcriptional regulator MalT/DNA-binding SARP family transcriptional activator
MTLEDRIRLPALNLIHRRARLLNMVDQFIESRKRLITIYAPGGYGKSILLADFAQTTDFPVCWCSLETTDRDPTSFLTLLAFSIADRFHSIEPDGLLRLVERGDTQASVHRIAELLSAVGPHVIIIDDYHKAVSAGMTLALNRLLRQLPETSTVIVAARGDMALETGQIIDLLISDRAAGLSEEELRFTSLELQRVMLKRFGRQIEQERAEEIARATDGNIAQIFLAGHLTHTDRMIDNLSGRLSDDREVIYSYLADEVVGKQSPELQRFMLHTSVLPDMTIELCNDLLQMTEANTFIEALVHNDLFITQIGRGYRYHDLFAEFLRSKLAEDPTTYHQVVIRAASLLADGFRQEEAVNLYLSVQAWADAAALLESQSKFFYDTGRALTINHWLTQISEQELAQHPRLLLLRGQILNYDLGEPERAESYFKRAEEEFRRQDHLIAAAETQVWRSLRARMMGQVMEALALVNPAIEQLETLEANERLIAWAIRIRGTVHSSTGDLAGALEDSRRALELFEKLDDTYNVGQCHQDLGVILEQQGNISGAEHHYRQALRIWEALGNSLDLVNALNSMAVCAYLRGNYDEALNWFNECLEIALQIGATRYIAFAQAGIGDVDLDLKEYDRALEAYHVSTEFARRADVRWLEVYNRVKEGECYYQQQNLSQALKLATQAKEMAAEAGFVSQKGAALSLQAKIYVHQAEYETSFGLFAESMACLNGNDALEEAKARLWWGYSLLLDLRSSAANRQLQEAIRLALDLREIIHGLGPTILETQQLLLHFFHRTDTPAGVRDSIRLLLEQSPARIEILQPSLQIFALGVPNLIVAGERRQFSQRGKIRKLPEFLLYLAIEGGNTGCRWSEVSAALWPELESSKASTTFHQSLKRLRDVIFEMPDYIVVQDDYYRVNPQYLHWCDALAFNQLFERLATAAPEEALALQYELISLYQGEFLAGFELGEWGSLYRSKYEVRFLQVINLAAEELLRKNEPREALTVVDKGLAQDYFREDLHRLVLRAYAQLELYDHLAAHQAELSDTYRREFGAPLEPETVQLYEQLLIRR